MKTRLTEETAPDFMQRYGDCYGILHHKDREILVRINGDSDVNAQVMCSDAEGFEYVTRLNSSTEFEFLPLTRGLYPHRNSLVYVSRIPQRMWKRGICSDNTRILDLHTAKIISVNFANLEQIFNSGGFVRPSWEEFITKNKQGKPIAFPMSTMMGFVGRRLYLLDTQIGELTDDAAVRLDNKLFIQEVRDNLSKAGVKVSCVIPSN